MYPLAKKAAYDNERAKIAPKNLCLAVRYAIIKEKKRSKINGRKGQKLSETLSYKKKNYFEESSEKVRKEMFDYAEGYKAFLDAAKTEREGCAEAVRLAKEKGFTRYELGDSLK